MNGEETMIRTRMRKRTNVRMQIIESRTADVRNAVNAVRAEEKEYL